MIKTMVLLGVFLCLSLHDPIAAHGQEWASLKGRFVFEGEIPKPKYVAIPARLKATYGIPADFRLTDERLMIDEETQGIKNILVYAAPELLDSKIVMPIYPEPPTATPPEHVLGLENLVISPRISFMRKNQPLVLVNPYSLMLMFPFQPPSEKVVRYKVNGGGRTIRKVSKVTSTPGEFASGIGGGYSGWLLIRDNNYVDLTNKKGEFEIANLPVGTWKFVAWVEKSPDKLVVSLGGKQETWVKGEFTATIDNKGTDLGEIHVNEKNFK